MLLGNPAINPAVEIASPFKCRFDCCFPGKVKQGNAAVDCILEDAFHVIIFRLGELYAREFRN